MTESERRVDYNQMAYYPNICANRRVLYTEFSIQWVTRLTQKKSEYFGYCYLDLLSVPLLLYAIH